MPICKMIHNTWNFSFPRGKVDSLIIGVVGPKPKMAREYWDGDGIFYSTDGNIYIVDNSDYTVHDDQSESDNFKVVYEKVNYSIYPDPNEYYLTYRYEKSR